MNPVDHVRIYPMLEFAPCNLTSLLFSLTEVVTINISVKLQPYHGTRHRVRKQVLLQLGELGYYVVRRRRRIRLSGVFERETYRGVHSLESVTLCSTIVSLPNTESLCF